MCLNQFPNCKIFQVSSHLPLQASVSKQAHLYPSPQTSHLVPQMHQQISQQNV